MKRTKVHFACRDTRSRNENSKQIMWGNRRVSLRRRAEKWNATRVLKTHPTPTHPSPKPTPPTWIHFERRRREQALDGVKTLTKSRDQSYVLFFQRRAASSCAGEDKWAADARRRQFLRNDREHINDTETGNVIPHKHQEPLPYRKKKRLKN